MITAPIRRARRTGRAALSVTAATLTAMALTTASFATGANASGARIPDSSGVTIYGAGSTFDQPFFTLAFYEYNKLVDPSVTVNYASIGSGGGQQDIEANIVDFGATDVPMLASDLALAKAPIVQVPVALGGEAISYNVPGISNSVHLRLTGSVLADIYLGKVTTWNDPEIAQLNPGVTIPADPIVVVHRSDGSGTSYAFTNYLADVSSTWSNQVGVGKTVSWPVGIGGKGNEGVAGLVKDTPGSIGYVELNYALVNNFTYCAIQNPMGAWVLPTLSSVAAEAALMPNVSATNFAIVDLKGNKAAYPISTFSWAAIYKTQQNATTGTALVDLMEWLTHPGQSYAGQLQYVPLPSSVQATAQAGLQQIVGTNGKSLLTQAVIAKYNPPATKPKPKPKHKKK